MPSTAALSPPDSRDLSARIIEVRERTPRKDPLLPADLSLALPFPLGMLRPCPRCTDRGHIRAIERAREAALVLAHFGEGATGVEIARSMRVSVSTVETLLKGRRSRAGDENVETFLGRLRREHPEWSSAPWTSIDMTEVDEFDFEPLLRHGRRVAPAKVPLYYARGRIRRWGRANPDSAAEMWAEVGRPALAAALVAELDLFLGLATSPVVPHTRFSDDTASGSVGFDCRCEPVRYWVATRRAPLPTDSHLWHVHAFRDSDVFRCYGRWTSYQLSVADVEKDAAGYASAMFDILKWQSTANFPESAALSQHLLAVTRDPVFAIWDDCIA